MCTGGINPKNVKDYLAFKQITACGGTWMFKKGSEDLIKTENWAEIVALCKEAVAAIAE
jgi:2-dehydro-3-deoxyphosphogluconate aldolase/(4S)-4-hydroxy-2-oxoglutarate aldolase